MKWIWELQQKRNLLPIREMLLPEEHLSCVPPVMAVFFIVCTVTITPWCRFEIWNSVTTRQDMPVFLVLVLTCHQQSQYHRSQGLATCLIFNFSLLVTLSKFFVTHFFIFHLDVQHPVWLEKLLMSVRITYLFFPFLKKSSCTPMRVWGYSRGPPFFLSCLLDAPLQRMEPKWMPGRISRA
jgi:hypothetical protein